MRNRWVIALALFAVAAWATTDVRKVGTLPSTPAKTTTALASSGSCTTVGAAGCTIIYASTDWVTQPNITVTIKETVGTNPVTDVLVEWSPDGVSFEAWDNDVTFKGLGANAIKSLAITGNSRRFLRIEAGSALGSTVDVWVTSNQG